MFGWYPWTRIMPFEANIYSDLAPAATEDIRAEGLGGAPGNHGVGGGGRSKSRPAKVSRLGGVGSERVLAVVMAGRARNSTVGMSEEETEQRA